MEPKDSLAFIGRNPGDAKNIYIATGDSGNGMTHGTIAGTLLSDMILEKENTWANLYDPFRNTKGSKPNNNAPNSENKESNTEQGTDKKEEKEKQNRNRNNIVKQS